jgi:hypothetical protein
MQNDHRSLDDVCCDACVLGGGVRLVSVMKSINFKLISYKT